MLKLCDEKFRLARMTLPGFLWGRENIPPGDDDLSDESKAENLEGYYRRLTNEELGGSRW